MEYLTSEEAQKTYVNTASKIWPSNVIFIWWLTTQFKRKLAGYFLLQKLYKNRNYLNPMIYNQWFCQVDYLNLQGSLIRKIVPAKMQTI